MMKWPASPGNGAALHFGQTSGRGANPNRPEVSGGGNGGNPRAQGPKRPAPPPEPKKEKTPQQAKDDSCKTINRVAAGGAIAAGIGGGVAAIPTPWTEAIGGAIFVGGTVVAIGFGIAGLIADCF
jgi:hypothetical protein